MHCVGGWVESRAILDVTLNLTILTALFETEVSSSSLLPVSLDYEWVKYKSLATNGL
jgi:hypothetical protein